MNTTKVTSDQTIYSSASKKKGEQDSVRMMLTAMYSSLKNPDTSQLQRDISKDLAATASSVGGKPEMKQLAALMEEVSKWQGHGGMTENQRQLVADISAVLRDGKSNVAKTGQSIAAFAKLSSDGFTEADAQKVKQLLHAESDKGGKAKVTDGDPAKTADNKPGHGIEESGKSHIKQFSSVESTTKSSGSTSGKSNPDEILKISTTTKTRDSDYGPELGKNKKMIIDALDKVGASTKEKALVLAMAMQETNAMNVAQGDHSKSGLSKNVSAFNINIAMLEKNGGNPGLSNYDRSVNLDDPANIGKAAVLTLQGIRERGANSWIAGIRGGAEAARRMDETGSAVRSDDNKESDIEYFGQFNNSIASDYKAILNDPSLMTNNKRVENDSRPQRG